MGIFFSCGAVSLWITIIQSRQRADIRPMNGIELWRQIFPPVNAIGLILLNEIEEGGF
jgi:hypothetical protein